MSFCLIALVAVALMKGTFAQNKFINPVASNASTTGFPEWTFGSQQDIRWSTDYSTISLVLWQDYSPADDGSSYYDLLLDTVPYQSSLSYTVKTSIDLDPNNVFYLRLYDGNSSSPTYIESHMFEIVKESKTSTVSVTVTATPTQVTATVTQVMPTEVAWLTGGTAGTAAATPNASTNASTSGARSGGLTLGDVCRLGVSVGIGIALLLI